VAIDQQAEAIRVFARERGWTASITKQCLRVTFRKMPNR
jgi:cupin superfamily acireductone dioxygenase involved in methionine salvage